MQIIISISYAYFCCVYIIPVKPNTKDKLCMATMLLFHIVQKYYMVVILLANYQLLLRVSSFTVSTCPTQLTAHTCCRVAVGSEKWTPQSFEYRQSHVISFCSCHLIDHRIEVVPGSVMSLPSVVKTFMYSCSSMFYTTYDFHQISSTINFYHF